MTNDGQIRNRDQIILDIVGNIMSNQDFTINLCSEGPCCEHVGLYGLLDMICERLNFAKHRISIQTPNLLEQHDHYKIIKKFNFWELEDSISNSKKFSNIDKCFDQEFKHFGNFIGHSNKHRLKTSSLLRARYADQTIQSYHCRVTEPYHREYIGLEDLMFLGEPGEVLDAAYQHIRNSPMQLDTIETFPILQPANLNILKYYPRFFVEIVNLTFFSGRTFYVDEKIWRPMLAMTPFLVQGPANLIKNLRRIGFKTFDQWWDEGYSEDPDECQVGFMFDNIDRLSKLSVKELEPMYADMLPTLEHNRNLLLELTNQRVESVFNDH